MKNSKQDLLQHRMKNNFLFIKFVCGISILLFQFACVGNKPTTSSQNTPTHPHFSKKPDKQSQNDTDSSSALKRYPGYVTKDLPPSLGRPLDGLVMEELEFTPKQTKTLSLSNGMTVYLIEDHELPLVNIAVLTDVGAIHVPLEKLGLTDLVSASWRSGGTYKNPGDKLDQILEDRAAALDVSIGDEASRVRMSLLSRDLAWGVSILADVVGNPAFPEEKMKLEKVRIQEELRRQNDDPGSIAYRLLDQRFYGDNNVWGKRPTVDSIERLSRKDLIAFHKNLYHPKRMRLVVSGDVKEKEVISLLEESFSSWKPKWKSLPKTVVPQMPKKIELFYIEMALPQTTFLLAVPAVGRKHPSQVALSVFNDILGGSGFDSLLMEEIRSNRGLAYGVSSSIDVAGNEKGMLSIVGQTKTESTVQSISLALQILDSLRSGKGLKEKDIERAKKSTLNSFVFRFVSPFSIALQDATYDLFGFPRDYLTTLPDTIRALTAADLAKAAQENIDTTRMVLIVVGNKKRFDAPLSKLGLGEPVELLAPNKGPSF